MTRTSLATLALSGILSAQPPAAPAPPPASVPLVLTSDESKDLTILQLKLKVLQQDISIQGKELTGEINQYQQDVVKNHPDSKYQLNMGTLTWQPIPQPPPPAVKAPEPPKADPKTKK